MSDSTFNCRFKYSRYKKRDYYECLVTSGRLTKPIAEVRNFHGVHENDHTNSDVDFLLISNQPHETLITVNFFPRGLYKLFANLSSLWISDAKLMQISRQDLFGLENLKELWLPHNELKLVPSDLLVGMTKLKNINLANNQIEIMSSDLLKPVLRNGLKSVNFCQNPKIDASFKAGRKGDGVKTVLVLMKIIDKSCDHPMKQKIPEAWKELWESKNDSDFTIGVGASEFAVHKTVLSLASSVFAAAFEHDMQEKQLNVMHIEDVTAEAVEDFLRFIYTGQLDDATNAMDVYELASKYDIPDLKSRTETLILFNIDESNAIEVFAFAHLHNSDDIKQVAFRRLQLTFPGANLDERLMEQPEELKDIVEALKNRAH